jgi:hypothetical protein
MPRRATTVKDEYVPPPPNDDHEMTIEELRTEAVGGTLQIAQYICLGFGLFADAGNIGRHAPGFTKETVALAAKNKQVASKVDLLIQIGPYTGIIAIGLPFIMQTLVNHKVFKAERFANLGVVTPETLEYEMKTEIMRQQMEAMQKQQAMEDEMRAMHEEMAARQAANGHSDVTDPDFQTPENAE